MIRRRLMAIGSSTILVMKAHMDGQFEQLQFVREVDVGLVNGTGRIFCQGRSMDHVAET